LWTHYGRQPHFAETKRPPSTVGSKAYIIRWGGWRAALSAFIKYVNQEPQQTPVQSIKKAESKSLQLTSSTPRMHNPVTSNT
jgi:hypothetical protein